MWLADFEDTARVKSSLAMGEGSLAAAQRALGVA